MPSRDRVYAYQPFGAYPELVDPDMVAPIEDHLKENGVHIVLNDGLTSFANTGKTLHLNSGKTIEADMVILAIGIKPETSLAANASLEIGSKGTIKVNAYMQTTDPDIYALGDAVEI